MMYLHHPDEILDEIWQKIIPIVGMPTYCTAQQHIDTVKPVCSITFGTVWDKGFWLPL